MTTEDNIPMASELDMEGLQLDTTPTTISVVNPKGEVIAVPATETPKLEAAMGTPAAVVDTHADDPAIKAQQAQIAYMERNGLGYTKVEKDTTLPDGTVVRKNSLMINSIPEEFQELLSFFLDDQPCWFTGCEDLRELYHAELGEDASCTSCHKGALIRKYTELAKAAVRSDKQKGIYKTPAEARMDKLKERIAANKAQAAQNEAAAMAAHNAHVKEQIEKINNKQYGSESNSTTGSGEVSGSAESSSKRAGGIMQMLRRATDRVKQVFTNRA